MVYSSALFFSGCTTGTYGVNCESRCDTCVDKICELRDGNCAYSCIKGFKRVRCNLSGMLKFGTRRIMNCLQNDIVLGFFRFS